MQQKCWCGDAGTALPPDHGGIPASGREPLRVAKAKVQLFSNKPCRGLGKTAKSETKRTKSEAASVIDLQMPLRKSSARQA